MLLNGWEAMPGRGRQLVLRDLLNEVSSRRQQARRALGAGIRCEEVGMQHGAENTLPGAEKVGASPGGGKRGTCPGTQAELTRLALCAHAWMRWQARLAWRFRLNLTVGQKRRY